MNHNKLANLTTQYQALYTALSGSPTCIGNYRILKPLGQGSFGTVYLAQHTLTGTKVVLKSGKKGDVCMVREVFYQKMFSYTNITKLYEVIVMESQVWLVLEYCESGDLQQQAHNLMFDEKRRVIAEIFSAVHYIHSLGCAHRDLKLENVLLDASGQVKLSDFGFTREVCGQMTTVCGSEGYMAPEIVTGSYDGVLVDIWALGVMCYLLLYGKEPSADPTAIAYPDTVPVEAVNMLKGMLCVDPAKRTKSVGSLLQLPWLQAGQELQRANLAAKTVHKPFKTKSERELLRKLKRAGLDTQQLKLSVKETKCDSLYAIWFLLLNQPKEVHRQHSVSSRRNSRLKISSRQNSLHSGRPSLGSRPTSPVGSVLPSPRTSFCGNIDAEIAAHARPPSPLSHEIKFQSIAGAIEQPAIIAPAITPTKPVSELVVSSPQLSTASSSSGKFSKFISRIFTKKKPQIRSQLRMDQPVVHVPVVRRNMPRPMSVLSQSSIQSSSYFKSESEDDRQLLQSRGGSKRSISRSSISRSGTITSSDDEASTRWEGRMPSRRGSPAALKTRLRNKMQSQEVVIEEGWEDEEEE